MTTKVCFIGGGRHDFPLNTTDEKKFSRLSCLGELFVVGFSKDLMPRVFVSGAHFFLLPQIPIAILRYVELLCCGTLVLLWLVIRHRVRVLIAQGPHEGAAATVVARLARVFGRRVVLIVESHGDFEESLFLQRRVWFPAVYRFVMTKVARLTLNQADILRAVSGSTQRQLAAWVPNKPIVQFPAWTDIEPFRQAGTRSRQGTKQHLVYCGVLIPRKGVHHLIRAMALIVKELSEPRLTIVGRRANPVYADQLVESVRKLGLADRVSFAGELSQEGLAAMMATATVFVLPSYSEGLPRVVFEAMAAGLPVVATAVSGIPDIVVHGYTGWLVPPGDESALANRLLWVLRHDNEAKKVGQQAKIAAQDVFSTERYLKGYNDLFLKAQNLLDKGSKGREATAL